MPSKGSSTSAATRRPTGRTSRSTRSWRASRRRRRSGRRCRRRATTRRGREPMTPDEGRSDGDTPASDLGELLADPVDAHLFGPRKRSEAKPKPAGQLGARDRVEFSDARFDSDLFPDNTSIPDTELATLAVTDSGASAARERGAARLRPSCRSARPLAKHPGARRPRRRLRPGRARSRGAGGEPPSRHPRGALAVASSAPRRLVPRRRSAGSRHRAGSTKCWSRAPR